MFHSKKPYSAVTVTIENLTAERYPEDDLSGIPDLVEAIRLQATGPAEAARALRKKLKYGTPHRQIRALVLLDGLIQNAGREFQRAFADEPLLERLRVCATSPLSDGRVRRKCAEVFAEWAAHGGAAGLGEVARLHRELPRRGGGVMTEERSRVVAETENPFGDEEEEEAEAEAEARRGQKREAGTAGQDAWSSMASAVDASILAKAPGASASASASASAGGKTTSGGHGKSKSWGRSKDKGKGKDKGKTFDLEQERDKMRSVIADASIASTGLVNCLQMIDRERERVSENGEAARRFEGCKVLRRRILRYIHQVDSEAWLGSLLHANDELVRALMAFEQLDRSIEADSDSDDELAEQAHRYRMISEKAQRERASASGAKSPDAGPAAKTGGAPSAPARPLRRAERERGVPSGSASEEEADEDEEDPFGDKNVVSTPGVEVEGGEPRW